MTGPAAGHSGEVVAVPQDLAQAKAELFFLVAVGDALDLRDEHRPACLSGEIVVRLPGQPGSWLNSRFPQRLGQLIRGACTAARRIVMSVAWNTASEEWVKFEPRSRIRNR